MMCCPGDSKFLLDHSRPQDFVTSQWQENPDRISPYYLTYRSAVCLVSVLGLFLCLLTLDYRPLLFIIYISDISFVFLVAFQLVDLALILSVLARRKGRVSAEDSEENGEKHLSMGFLHKSAWLLSNLASAGCAYVALFFWTALYDYKLDGPPQFWDFYIHGFNAFLVYLDLFITARPWRWQHVYQPFSYGLLYTLFTIIYFICGGYGRQGKPYIYRILKWQHPGHACLTAFGSCFLIAAIHLLNCALSEMRKYLAGRRSNKRDDKE